ncbi:MAG: homoserine dehydrogenase [Acidobacteria bacterium]|nr:homoserine dehydrogenase [Acidobacteriota bacterium]
MTNPNRLRIGLLGFGTVGQAFTRLVLKERGRLLRDHALDLEVVAIGNRRIDEKRAGWAGEGVRFTDDLASVATDPGVDLVVELLGGLEPARSLQTAALSAGKPVVTANKMLFAHHGEELAALAREKGVSLGLEAAVAGGIPILRALRESFAADTLTSVSGILNGTSNFILTTMEATGRSYADVLAEAQRLGYAEADPASDVEGNDAAYKLALLARMAFGTSVPVSAVRCSGITHLLPCDFEYARMLERTPRQLAVARRVGVDGALALSVSTHLVSQRSLLAKIEGPFNAVAVEGETGGTFVLSGRGAGGGPTATAVLSDVIEIARSGARPGVPPLGVHAFAPFTAASPAASVSAVALRFVVKDAPGIIASISRILAENEINIDAVFQTRGEDKAALPFVVTLEPVAGDGLARALEALAALPFHQKPPVAFPLTD